MNDSSPQLWLDPVNFWSSMASSFSLQARQIWTTKEHAHILSMEAQALAPSSAMEFPASLNTSGGAFRSPLRLQQLEASLQPNLNSRKLPIPHARKGRRLQPDQGAQRHSQLLPQNRSSQKSRQVSTVEQGLSLPVASSFQAIPHLICLKLPTSSKGKERSTTARASQNRPSYKSCIARRAQELGKVKVSLYQLFMWSRTWVGNNMTLKRSHSLGCVLGFLGFLSAVACTSIKTAV